MAIGNLGSVGRLGLAQTTGVRLPALRSKTVWLGDSNTAGANGLASSYAYQASIIGRGRFKTAKNAGTAGQRTDQIYARMDTDVVAYTPEVCFVLAGTNDIAQSIDDATIRTNIALIGAKLKANGIAGVFLSLPPNSNDLVRPATHNAWLRSWCGANGHYFVDIYTPLSNGAGDWNSTYNGDAVHTNVAGALLAAQTLLAALANTYTAWPLASSDTAGSDNIVGNAVSMTDSNADGVPDGFSALGTGVTYSIITDAQRGKGVRMAMSSASSGGIQYLTAANWSVGEYLLPMFDLEVTKGTGLSISMGLRFVGPNTNSLFLTPWAEAASGAFSADLGGLVIPSLTTSVSVRLYANGSGNIDLFKPTCRNLSRSATFP